MLCVIWKFNYKRFIASLSNVKICKYEIGTITMLKLENAFFRNIFGI